ncbi:MAG: DUF4115 domain-containing protein [Chloroflexi bacterium]|nr:DUF4115 domain-containing protein [Chloroflexota bacterium]
MDAYSLGQFLRSSREAKEIELAEVVAKLRIRQPILEAFEAGDFAATEMSEIQVRGMLRNYARFLGLDEDDVLRLYDDARFGKSRRRRWPWRSDRKANRGSRHGDPPLPMQEIDIEQSRSFHRRRLWSIFLLFVLSSAAIGTIAFVTMELIGPQGTAEVVDSTAVAEAQITAPPIQTLEPTPAIVPTVATGTPALRSRYSGNGVLVNILVTQRNWMRIIGDGVERFAGIAVPDTIVEYSALTEIIVSASNAKGLDIEWNGQQQPRAGGRGQRVDIRFSATDIAYSLGPDGAPTLVSPTTRATAFAAMTIAALTPSDTPGPSPTPTLTPVPTNTLTLTPVPTLTPSITPTASDTPTVTETPTITLTPTETAILPPRVTQAGLKPKKQGA